MFYEGLYFDGDVGTDRRRNQLSGGQSGRTRLYCADILSFGLRVEYV